MRAVKVCSNDISSFSWARWLKQVDLYNGWASFGLLVHICLYCVSFSFSSTGSGVGRTVSEMTCFGIRQGRKTSAQSIVAKRSRPFWANLHAILATLTHCC